MSCLKKTAYVEENKNTKLPKRPYSSNKINTSKKIKMILIGIYVLYTNKTQTILPQLFGGCIIYLLS